jgi:hypothetical protein
MDLLRARADPLGGEVAQCRAEQPVLGGRAEVVCASTRQEEAGDGVEGGVE